MGDKLRERQKGVQDALADAAAEAERAINGVRTVKLFAAEAEVCASYGGRVEARAQAEDVGLLAAFNEAGVILPSTRRCSPSSPSVASCSSTARCRTATSRRFCSTR